MKVSVLVMTCDSYEDLWQPFFKCFNKYWDCPYEVYLGTETKNSKLAKTIKTKGSWTKRVRESLEKIKSEYVIFLLDDFFIRKKVDQEAIDWCIDNFDDNTATFDFQNVLEGDYLDREKKGDYRLRRNQTRYICNCQPSIWDRKKLISLLQEDMNPWEWEMQVIDSPYKHYVNRAGDVINIGYYKDREPWGVVQGKWSTELIDFFKKEKIEVDFSKRGFYDVDLSIIIPYYKTLDLTKELMDVLVPQLTPKVEVILIDDGCDEKVLDEYPIKVIHQVNGGVSKARNTGLNNATGKYITFIDSDDMITHDYIEKVLSKIKIDDFDYCFFSWKYKQGREVIIKDYPPKDNTSIWNCIYNRETIGNNRFPENKQIGEDTDFNLKVRKGKKANLEDVLYIYNCEREGSLSTMSRKGLLSSERGIETQIIIYRSRLTKMGGIETAIYNACKDLKDEYDIIFLYDNADGYQLSRLEKLVRCIKYNGQPFKCNRLFYYGSSPQHVEKTIIADEIHHHCCNNSEVQLYKASPNATIITADSETSAKSYAKVTGDKCDVLYNLFSKPEPKKCFHLMSATRLGFDKGS
jgi:glycosyltransferase involved in cell wall biosynthesis